MPPHIRYRRVNIPTETDDGRSVYNYCPLPPGVLFTIYFTEHVYITQLKTVYLVKKSGNDPGFWYAHVFVRRSSDDVIIILYTLLFTRYRIEDR